LTCPTEPYETQPKRTMTAETVHAVTDPTGTQPP
jgi:hypothetical protein